MMKSSNFQFIGKAGLLIGVFSILLMTSCKKVDPVPDPIASFQFAISQTNFFEVAFTNYSQNAETYLWNFGDTQTSTDENPTHVYAAVGTYTVSLTATNSEGVTASFDATLEIKDPNEALALLAGTESKMWKLWRGEGTTLGVGPNAEQARIWWALANDGARPCVYQHKFTFHRNGSFVFDDDGIFWGEVAVFAGTAVSEKSFPAVAANMVNKDGADVSAWLGGTHAFSYDPVVGQITLTGNGAWMGMPQLGTVAEVLVPDASRTFKATIEEKDGYDLLHIEFVYAELYWDFFYASYDDWSMEPDIVTEFSYGEDLPDFAPDAMFNTFAGTDEANVKYLVPTTSAVTVTPIVDDPADATAAKVGRYVRGTEMYPDLKFAMDFDIQFDKLTSFSIDVYIPSSNTYSEGGLTKGIQIWIADLSQTQEFWNSWCQYDVDPTTIVTDQWKTYTFQLESPTSGVGTPKTRKDLDLVGLAIGGSGHTVNGTFYIRNFKFE